MHKWLENNRNKEIIIGLQKEREDLVAAALIHPEDKSLYQTRIVTINEEIERRYYDGIQ